MDLSVVVLSWNTADSTLRALGSALAGTASLEAEVFCVDNGSRDDTVARVRSERPEVQVIENGRNLGFARGNNRALPHLSGRHVCFLNSDAAPHPACLPPLVQRLDEDPDIGIIAPRLVGPDGGEQRAARIEPTPAALLHRYTALRWTPFGRRDAKAWSRGVASEAAVDVASVIGACLVIRRSLLERLGGFDEAYPFYFEDADLCRRARDLGLRVVFDPEGAPVEHEGGVATAARGGPPRREMLEGALRYARKGMTLEQGQAYGLAFVPLALLRGLLAPALLALRGTGRALRGRPAAAEDTWRAASSWLRFLERDALASVRLLSRPRRASAGFFAGRLGRGA